MVGFVACSESFHTNSRVAASSCERTNAFIRSIFWFRLKVAVNQSVPPPPANSLLDIDLCDFFVKNAPCKKLILINCQQMNPAIQELFAAFWTDRFQFSRFGKNLVPITHRRLVFIPCPLGRLIIEFRKLPVKRNKNLIFLSVFCAVIRGGTVDTFLKREWAFI